MIYAVKRHQSPPLPVYVRWGLGVFLLADEKPGRGGDFLDLGGSFRCKDHLTLGKGEENTP